MTEYKNIWLSIIEIQSQVVPRRDVLEFTRHVRANRAVRQFNIDFEFWAQSIDPLPAIETFFARFSETSYSDWCPCKKCENSRK